MRNQQIRLTIIIGLIILVLAILGIQLYPKQDLTTLGLVEANTYSESTIETEIEAQNESEELGLIYVDIKGAVKKPNMYALPQGSRMYDAIEIAGGFTEIADRNFVNLAQLLTDQMLIYIYEEGEQEEMGLESSMSSPQSIFSQESSEDTLININTASEEELIALPNIGPKKAQAIIQYRTDYGSFQSIEGLLEVSGIGEKTFQQLESLVTVQ